METDRLKYFCTIVDTGSLTKAADLLNVSHSGLSKAMSTLQDELGFKIFIPKGRGLELTARGKELYEQSRKVLELVHSLKKSALKDNQNVLRLGCPEVLTLALAEFVAQEFKSGLTIEELDSGKIESHVLDRKVDFAFTFVPFPHKDLEHLKITTITLHSLCRVNAFREKDPETLPYVIPSYELQENPLSLRIKDGWNLNLPRFTPYRASHFSIALRMVQAGACAIYAPVFLIPLINAFSGKDHQLTEVPLPTRRRTQERTQRDIFLVKRQADDESKAMKILVKRIRQICRDS